MKKQISSKHAKKAWSHRRYSWLLLCLMLLIWPCICSYEWPFKFKPMLILDPNLIIIPMPPMNLKHNTDYNHKGNKQ